MTNDLFKRAGSAVRGGCSCCGPFRQKGGKWQRMSFSKYRRTMLKRWTKSHIEKNAYFVRGTDLFTEEFKLCYYGTTGKKVGNLIKKSLEKRIKGHGQIDNVLDNSELIERWSKDISILGYYGTNLEEYYIDKIRQEIVTTEGTIEDCRTRLFLSKKRFPDEIYAYGKYSEMMDSGDEDVIVFMVKEALSNVEEGDFFFC
jgi:hypothetical protein